MMIFIFYTERRFLRCHTTFTAGRTLIAFTPSARTSKAFSPPAISMTLSFTSGANTPALQDFAKIGLPIILH